jgi:hypothetical protein
LEENYNKKLIFLCGNSSSRRKGHQPTFYSYSILQISLDLQHLRGIVAQDGVSTVSTCKVMHHKDTALRKGGVNGAPKPRFATSGITPLANRSQMYRCLTNKNNPLAIRSQILFLTVAISGKVIIFVAIRSLNTVVCHEPRYTFDCGLPQQSEIQYQPF